MRRILVVEDDSVVASGLERQLMELGYDVTLSVSAHSEPIAAAAEVAHDLLLMHIVLDDARTKVAAFNELRRHLEIPFLLIIAEEDEHSLNQAGLDAPFDYVVKPFTDRELRANVELALCRHDIVGAVREMEDRFFATSIDLLCFLGFNGYFKRVNPAWERALGFTRQELMSRPFIEFVHPDDRERTLKQNSQVRSGGQALAFENRYLCKDGSYRWLRWNAAPDTTTQVIYSVARDITANKKVEEEREQLVRELQDALAEVKTLQNILPICSYCRKIRDDENYWHTVEVYIGRHTSSQFSHSICPSCMAAEVEPQFDKLERQ